VSLPFRTSSSWARRAAAFAGMALASQAALRAQTSPSGDEPPCHGEPAMEAAPDSPPTDRKSVLLRAILDELIASSAPFLGEGTLRAINLRIAALRPGAAPVDVMNLYASRGDELMQVGRIEEAIQDYERMTAIAKTLNEPRTMQACLRRLGVAWMRLGERQNCVARHNADSCLLPLEDGAVHVDRKGSETAVGCFTAALNLPPVDNATIWLLNLAHMTLGSWPDGVPARWRIPARAFAPEHALPRMFDVAPKLGLATPDRAGGAAFDDFTGDGLLDLVTSSLDLRQRLHFFEQKPDATFVEVGVQKGLAGVLGGLNLMHFDANGDGRLDLLVLRGGWMGVHGRIPNSLLIQQADGTFLDLTLEAGIEILAPTQAGAVADVDNDGDLDLFLGYEDLHAASTVRFRSRLFLNRGDGTFEDGTKAAGVGDAGFVKGAAFGDYDRDGLPDLYVSTMSGPNHLYRNEGGGKFSDVAASLGVAAPEDAFSCFFFDYDNDGHLDLYVSCYEMVDRAGATCAFYRDGSVTCDVNRLYRNDGKGGFVDVTREVRLDRVAFPMGSNFGDVDNDGWSDLYLATGSPEFAVLVPNIMYRNDGGRRFQDVTSATDTGHLQKGHSVAFADWDEDGDQDLFEQLGGAFLDDGFADALYENPGHGHHWLTVRLVGTKSNRFGIGARIRARIAEPAAAGTPESVIERNVFAFVGTNSSFGGNSLQAEMGLGKATRLVELEVYWPASGTLQTFRDVPLDRIVRIVEGEQEPVVLPRRESW